MSTKKDYVMGSGNVFADLRVHHPEEALAKAELAHKITKLIERRRLTQAEAAKILDVDQPKVSALRCGRLSASDVLPFRGWASTDAAQACPIR